MPPNITRRPCVRDAAELRSGTNVLAGARASPAHRKLARTVSSFKRASRQHTCTLVAQPESSMARPASSATRMSPRRSSPETREPAVPPYTARHRPPAPRKQPAAWDQRPRGAGAELSASITSTGIHRFMSITCRSLQAEWLAPLAPPKTRRRFPAVLADGFRMVSKSSKLGFAASAGISKCQVRTLRKGTSADAEPTRQTACEPGTRTAAAPRTPVSTAPMRLQEACHPLRSCRARTSRRRHTAFSPMTMAEFGPIGTTACSLKAGAEEYLSDSPLVGTTAHVYLPPAAGTIAMRAAVGSRTWKRARTVRLASAWSSCSSSRMAPTEAKTRPMRFRSRQRPSFPSSWRKVTPLASMVLNGSIAGRLAAGTWPP
mmetsp:Transcript_4756/g.20333  ORF Transcript_4756/g.20333 Transcript_4756/m.20333 type:complete len:374 (-) Transcript_4756:878-1999(-)